MDTNPLLPDPVEIVLLSTFVMGVVCTVMASRYAAKGEMRLSAALTVLVLNFVLVIGPLAAAVGMVVWRQQRRGGRQRPA
ncbi:hypothetical protein [Nocardioides mesophilus]|uniref:Uncharacterized protein n=1 Tax=Nocardioides mesophilus TaxID=433659 RepID=A0A7G9RDS7_9ACTN|nr:hypothetical protein [Nocardioides mesophilus]QNN53752.1 hypothetical protein H9L09_04895 [Nocardioides mesophilus]